MSPKYREVIHEEKLRKIKRNMKTIPTAEHSSCEPIQRFY